jgi:predicted MFS family arabinose efflux permease
MTASAPSSPVASRRAGLLRHRDLRLLLAGQAVSELGSQIGSIALPLVAVLGLGASPLQVGVLTAAGTISFAVLALPAGVWVDRLPRRPLLIGADLVRGAALLTVPVAAALHRLTLTQLAVVALAVGMARVLFDVAYPSYLPTLVDRAELVRGNAYLESSRSATQLTGPGLGGWLVQLVGAPMAVLADAVSFLASAGCLVAIKASEPRPAWSGRRELRRELAEGLRFVLGRPALRAITVCTALTNLLWAAAGTVQLLFLVHQVGLAPATIGLLVSAGAAGGLLAALAATRVAGWAGDASRLIWLPVTMTAPFALCTPLTAPGWRVALFPIGVAVTSFGQALYNIGQISFRQALCPPELLGRMNASIRFLVFGALPLGGLLGGLAGERLGVHPTLWLCGIGLALTPIPLLASLRNVAGTRAGHAAGRPRRLGTATRPRRERMRRRPWR